ncbi:MAG: peroxiredoxin [Gammaproteobacteria bacterium]
MSDIAVGQPAPDFELPATGDKTISLSGLKGKNVVLYFYPKDNTPGCTREGQDFRDHYNEFGAFDTVILGVSRDGLDSHEKFKTEQNFQFDLLSDKDEVLCKLFDVIKLKNIYGKESMGVERSTFLIDKNGILRQEWRKVKVEGHIEEILQALSAL